jgi:hypothetical protein
MTTRGKAVFPALTLTASILGLAMVATPSWAATAPPAMTLAIAGASVTFDSTGTVTYTGACNASACPATVMVGNGSNGFNAGQIAWFGSIGAFTGSVEGQTRPALTSPEIDILVSQMTNTGAAAGTLTISWTDVGFTVGESPSTMNVTTNGVGTVSYTSYVDNTNKPFGTGTAVATVGNAGGVASGSGPTASPFSITNAETITLPANSATLSSDFSFHVAPHPPLALSCTGLAAGTVGTPYTAALSATGGVPSYTFQITSGSISPLLLNLSSGVISGTPTTPGTLSFTAQVTDSSGNTGFNTAAASCSIIVTTPKTTPPCLTGGDAATIGFWHNKNGQALILAMNGSSSSKTLANWLATNFPYLYGAHSSNNLTNQTNTQVAALFLTYFGASGQKTSAQILAGALASYVTSSTLAGTTATGYGFNSSAGGTGAKGYNVGSDGSAIGLVNNTTYTVLQLLQQANLDEANGTFNANAFNDIFNNINTTGDIS